jgi:hypothetical protein
VKDTDEFLDVLDVHVDVDVDVCGLLDVLDVMPAVRPPLGCRYAARVIIQL